jgi:hypothetical protein
MTEYNIYSNFLMVCNCKSYRDSLTINSYISVQLKINKYDIKYLLNYKEKPVEYDILLHDLYKDEYWVLDRNYIINEKQFDNINYNDIVKYVIQYVEDNNRIFKLCFIEMKHFLLNKLNNTNVIIFNKCKLFDDYYKEAITNKIIVNYYYNTFISILEEIKEDEKIGNYFLLNHKEFFDEMLSQYCITHYDKKIITDANYIIMTINNLLK